MKTLTVAALALVSLGLAPAARASIDFTLVSRHGSPEGPDAVSQYIADGDSHIYLRVPRDWKSLSSAERLSLVPPQTGGEVQITQVRGAQALPMDPAGLEALRKDARAHLPDGAKEIQAVGEDSGLLPLFGWKSFEVTFQYEFFGQRMRRSLLYINMIPGRVVQVSVTAATDDFEAIHEEMRKLMYGWFEPKRDLRPDAAEEYESGEFKGS